GRGGGAGRGGGGRPRGSRREPRRAKAAGTASRFRGAEGVAMMTLGKPRGAATRATLGGIAAGLMIGLAACGNTVAGTGTAGTAVAGPGGPATAAHTTPRPSPGAVNPGGGMIPASGPAPAPGGRATPKPTRMTFRRSTRPPNLPARGVLPAGFPIRAPATVRDLATLLCALPPVPAGQLMCPNNVGGSYRMSFVAGNRLFPQVVAEMSGCRVVIGLGVPRSWSASAALGQALAQHLGVHPLVPPY